MRYCRYCGSSLPHGAEYCNQCGAALEKMKYCPFCGAVMLLEDVTCPECGRSLKPQPQPYRQQEVPSQPMPQRTVPTVQVKRGSKNKWVAFFLCFFLGCFGAHKFYEGKTGMGIFYLCTLGCFSIGWFVDLIVILCKPHYYDP